MRATLIILCIIFIQCETPQERIQTLPLKQVVEIINTSLENTNTELEKDNHHISNATITLKTIYDKSAGGSFKLFIKASHNEDLSNASKFIFQYKKDRQGKTIDNSNTQYTGSNLFENELTNAIKSAVNDWQETQISINGLSKNTFSVDLAFTVKTNTKGGIEFKVCGTDIGANAECGKTAMHTISLCFQ